MAMTAEPSQAIFVQTYIPAGFSSGESETGRLSSALPECVRWDYETPYAKSFLLCGDVVWSWNMGEASGRRQRIEAEDQQGLDLLKLSVPVLRRRYQASLIEADEGFVGVVLQPKLENGEITDVKFTLDRKHTRLSGVSYRDVEGNQTRFEISDYQPLADREALSPPIGIEWLEE